MNCQPPKIISKFENIPRESGESFVGFVCGGNARKMVKKRIRSSGD